MKLITDHLDLWSSVYVKKATTGRGSNGKVSPYGIKKLRELILELAVRGKLVPQDPDDEPASVLLEKIAKEKARLIKKGKVKKQKELSPVDDDLPHELPVMWQWARLGEITNYGATDKAEPGSVDENTWVLELEDIEKITSKLLKKVRCAERQFRSSKNQFAVGDVLYGKLRPYLDKVLVADEAGVCTTEIMPVRGYLDIAPEYLRLLLKAPSFIEYANESTHGMNLPRLGTDKARLALIPVAPKKEQHRIVAKVDELMALCDQLEQQQTDSLQAHQTLVETILAALVRPTATNDAQDAQVPRKARMPGATGGSEDNAAAIFFEHFDTLFTTEASIDQLKQTILQLAVMGKLVPQDPKDEQASELMKRLATERDKWLENNKNKNNECSTMLRKLKKLKSPKEPFSIPSSWTTVYLMQLCRMLVDCHNKTAPYVDSGIPIIRTSNIRERIFRLLDVKYVSQDTYNYWSRRCPPASGDIIFTREAPMGEAAIIPEGQIFCLGQRTMLIRPMHKFVLKEYLLLALTEPHLLERASEHAIGSTVKHLRVGDVEKLNIPLPPLAEQHRIVAKVDELMALCDALKARLQDSQTTQIHLADAIVEQAVA